MKETLIALCEKIEPEVVAMRRALHAMPEASFCEKKTQARIAAYLKQAGIELKAGIAGTGVVGLIRGTGHRVPRRPGRGKAVAGDRGSKAGLPTIALRADMDALNLTERTGLRFASKHPGYMHACGHDAHMAMLLGAGIVLKGLSKDLPGNVRLIFQPAEETPPGGGLGMIKAGVLQSPEVGAVIGTHVEPDLPAGSVGLISGPISAAADDFNVRIIGKAGHGSAPHRGVDAIVVAAEFITALQAVVSRRVSAMDNVVVSVGKLAGGQRHNIIADTVEMEGTIRTRTAFHRREVPKMLKQILDGVCAAFGARAEFQYVKGYPAVVCDQALTKRVHGWCSDVLGPKRVLKAPGFEMGGEDFAYYAAEVPGTVIMVGVANPKKGKIHKLHHPEFDIDEDALEVGVRAMAYSAYSWLCGGD